MGRKVLFVFAGTGDEANDICGNYEKSVQFNDDVVRVYFNGCQDGRIGGQAPGLGFIKPNLDFVASRLRSCFSEDGELSLTKLKDKFGDAIIIRGRDEDTVKVEEIGLAGFSRGGVTTFVAARFLEDLNIPMSLFAQDPVPGDSKQEEKKPDSEYYKNQDLSDLKNLEYAEVLLGAYKKEVNPLHNKYFRQMAPLFNENCEHSIYTVPKDYHLQPSAISKNHRIDFLCSRDFGELIGYFNGEESKLFFVPKILQQKFHAGVDGRTQLSPRYKALLLSMVNAKHESVTEGKRVKIGQALYAIDITPDFHAKNELYSKIRRDKSSAGKALREFIVEFNNINQYVLRNTEDYKTLVAVNKFKSAVYELINAYPCKKADHHQKQALHTSILEQMKLLKGEIPDKPYSELSKLMPVFLQDNVIFNPDLTKYIEEKEKFRLGVVTEDALKAMVNLKAINNADELAENLYHMSERSRVAAYGKIAAKLPYLIENADQLGNIIRFFTPDAITATLTDKTIMNLIKSDISAVNLIMGKVFTNKQRQAVFNAVKNYITDDMQPTFKQLGMLMQYLTYPQHVAILQDIKPGSSADLIQIVDKLSTKQVNKLMPLFEKIIVGYLPNRAKASDDQALIQCLKDKVTGAKATKILDKILLNIELSIIEEDSKAVIERVRFMKNQICEENADIKMAKMTPIYNQSMVLDFINFEFDTPEELELFVKAVQRIDITTIDFVDERGLVRLKAESFREVGPELLKVIGEEQTDQSHYSGLITHFGVFKEEKKTEKQEVEQEEKKDPKTGMGS